MRLLAVLGLLAGCRGADPCPAARTSANDAVQHALHAARTEVEVLQNAADESPLQRTQLELTRLALDEKLEALESAMDCFGHDDCCARMPKLALADREKSVAIVHDIMATSPVPDPILALLSPAAKILDRTDAGPVSPVASEVTAWCTQMRTGIVRARAVGPEEWNKMEDAADVAAASSDAAIAAAQTRVDALVTWQTALAAKARPSPAPNQSLLDDAWPAIATYTSVCK